MTRVHALGMLKGLPVRRRLEGTRPLIVLYAALGVVSMITYYVASGVTSVIAYLLVSTLPVFALVVGPHLLRPSSMWPWYMLDGTSPL